MRATHTRLSDRRRGGGTAWYPPPGSVMSLELEQVCGSVAEWLGRWNCDQQVAGSTPGRRAFGCILGKVVHTSSVAKQYKLPRYGVTRATCHRQ